MKDKKSRNSKIRGFMGRFFPYIALFAIILTVMIVGSQDEQKMSISSTVLNVINDTSFKVTTDQLSESFIVAETANIFNLPSANSIGENFVSIAIRYTMTGGVDSGIIEKPNIIDTSNLSRGILTYIVEAGDNLPAIAARFGLSSTQIRWSNNMKNETIAIGQKLFLPSVPGILYTVRNGDTLEGIAEKYQSNASQIKTLNDLEISGLVVGQTIILPNGILPEKERPEYVPPAPAPTYTFNLSDSGVRHNMREIGSYSYWRYTVTPGARWMGNPSSEGQCTWFAWWWRRNYMPENYWLPTGVIGNARDWVTRLRSRYLVNQYPAYGAVVQTRTSNWGHVAVVTNVVEGEYILIQEMNWNYQPYRVYESRIYWADALKFVYIHGRY
ncbi:LysM peptidoglycan-binding domain-containing protein [Candidatus Saccharibacteria bacterium]|nr:LysM peptidoglycan-binding domain-containing protein [Candidatus Saccharibacteria bacterium]